MKRIILATLLLLPFLTPKAQNNGQSASTDAVKLDYIGYSGGNYVMNITNLQTCPSGDMRFEWFSKDTVIFGMVLNEVRTVLLPGPPSPLLSIKAKPEASCPTFSQGWAEVFSPTSLAATGMESFNVTVNNDKLDFKWTTQTEINNSHFVIEKSYDGKEWFTAGIIASKADKGNSSMPIGYSLSLDIYPKNHSGFDTSPLVLLLVILLILGIIARIVEKKILAAALGMCLIISTVGCKKNILEDELSKKQTVHFRLIDVDLDDNAHDHQNVRRIKI